MAIQEMEKPGAGEKTVMSVCCSHCGGACLLKVHVKDGGITRIETDAGREPQMRACLKGRAYRQRVYAPDRILYPMKRVGERGEGKFERISWDEALETVAGELNRVREKYGSPSILFKVSGGDQGSLHGRPCFQRLMNMAGGCSEIWGFFSYEGAIFAQLVNYGTPLPSNMRDDLINSRLIFLWGFDPAETVLQTNTTWALARAREAGARIISIDPQYNNTAATFAGEWVPIRPGTDTAMLLAMAHVMIQESLQDQQFLDKYTVGFEQFRDYVLGGEDGVPKTPAWAEEITGVPADTIESLARDYAATKPAALMAGIAAGRTAYGEQFHRAAITLAAMTGNVGVHGGDSGAGSYTGYRGRFPSLTLPAMPSPPNPVESKAPPREYAAPSHPDFNRLRPGHINIAKLADAILHGKSGGYPADYKLLFLVNTNFPNQYLNLNKAVAALKNPGLEFVVVCDQFMTPCARFADVLLPVCTFLERNDVTASSGDALYYGYMNQAIEPRGESKSHFDICTALAAQLGIEGYSDKTEDEWLRELVKNSGAPDYDSLKRDGIYKLRLAEPYVAFEEEIADPGNHPFPTPSGKIEIYSQYLADMGHPLLPPIPKYIETWESRNDPLAQKYPLQLVTKHVLRRAHSQNETVPWLREVQRQEIRINPSDAEARGIRDGDNVRVFNDRGATVLPARVTETIMPGTVSIPQGAWYTPDENGIDRAGCSNVLTRDEPSMAGAYPTNTTLVEVRRQE